MDINYGDDLPTIAGGFLGGLTLNDIEEIIGGLGDGIEENDKDLGYDTDQLETDDAQDSSLITEEETSPVKKLTTSTKKINGGGNVLQILASLIPTVFPKSYM